MRKNITALLAILFTLTLLPLQGAEAASPTVTFTNTAKMETVPDKSTLSLTISGDGESSSVAKTNYTRVEKAFNQLIAEQSVPKKNLSTSSLSSFSSMDANGVEKFYLNKYATLTFYSIEKANLFLGAVTDIEGLTLNSNYLSVSNPSKYEGLLLSKASKSAIARAKTYAKSLGFKGVRLIKLTEGQVNSYPGPLYAVAKDSSAGSPVIDAGSTELTLTITTTWSLVK